MIIILIAVRSQTSGAARGIAAVLGSSSLARRGASDSDPRARLSASEMKGLFYILLHDML